jgi:hypothetical protein
MRQLNADKSQEGLVAILREVVGLERREPVDVARRE